MDILVVSATEKEVLPFIQLPEQQRAGIDLLVTGVGMVATAFAIGQRVAEKPYSLLLNVGVAGSFDRAIALGEVVCVYQDTLAELGIEDGERFVDSATIGLAPHTFHGIADHPAAKGLRCCKGITVNTVHGHEESISAVVNRLHPDTESMEGAAVCYVADQAGIPALQIRAISNYVERRNRENWQIPLAIEHLNRWLLDFTRWQQHQIR